MTVVSLKEYRWSDWQKEKKSFYVLSSMLSIILKGSVPKVKKNCQKIKSH